MTTTATVGTWITLLGTGVFALAAWLHITNDERSAALKADPSPKVVVSHLGFMLLAISAWIVAVIEASAAVALVGFVDLVIFAGVGEDLLADWLSEPLHPLEGERSASRRHRPHLDRPPRTGAAVRPTHGETRTAN